MPKFLVESLCIPYPETMRELDFMLASILVGYDDASKTSEENLKLLERKEGKEVSDLVRVGRDIILAIAMLKEVADWEDNKTEETADKLRSAIIKALEPYSENCIDAVKTAKKAGSTAEPFSPTLTTSPTRGND